MLIKLVDSAAPGFYEKEINTRPKCISLAVRFGAHEPPELGSQSKVNPINPNAPMNESIFECAYSARNFAERVKRERERKRFGSHFNGTQMKFIAQTRCARMKKKYRSEDTAAYTCCCILAEEKCACYAAHFPFCSAVYIHRTKIVKQITTIIHL